MGFQRTIFYAGSPRFDAGNSSLAIATDKSALLPGQTATFANYTAYESGITGIIVDIGGTVSALTAADFAFKMGGASPADVDPALWAAAPAPTSIGQHPGAGVSGSTRVELRWDGHMIDDRWLQVTVLADSRTNLAKNDVFYYGNAIGETGNAADTLVTDDDENQVRLHPATLLDPVAVTNPYDFNRDGKVDAIDQLVARCHHTDPTDALQLLTLAAPLAAIPAPTPISGLSALLPVPRPAASPLPTRPILPPILPQPLLPASLPYLMSIAPRSLPVVRRPLIARAHVPLSKIPLFRLPLTSP